MPYRSKKPCAHPGCGELLKAGTTYCDKHQQKNTRYRNQRYNSKRDPRISQFYNSQSWRKLRAKKIKSDPLCEQCKRDGKIIKAEEVDHIIPVKVNFSKRLDFGNLQSLCKSCHKKKTDRDKDKYSL